VRDNYDESCCHGLVTGVKGLIVLEDFLPKDGFERIQHTLMEALACFLGFLIVQKHIMMNIKILRIKT
jgi:hypothetical protein